MTNLVRREVLVAELLPAVDPGRTRCKAITACAVCAKPLDGEAAEMGDEIHDGACWQAFKRQIARHP